MAYKYSVTLHLNKLLDEGVQHISQIIYYYNNTTFTQKTKLMTWNHQRTSWATRIIATSLWAGRFKVQIPVGSRGFSVLQNIQTSFEAHSAPIHRALEFFPGGKVEEA